PQRLGAAHRARPRDAHDPAVPGRPVPALRAAGQPAAAGGVLRGLVPRVARPPGVRGDRAGGGGLRAVNTPIYPSLWLGLLTKPLRRTEGFPKVLAPQRGDLRSGPVARS